MENMKDFICAAGAVATHSTVSDAIAFRFLSPVHSLLRRSVARRSLPVAGCARRLRYRWHVATPT